MEDRLMKIFSSLKRKIKNAMNWILKKELKKQYLVLIEILLAVLLIVCIIYART